MEKIIIQHQIIYFFVVLVFTASLNGCSSDSDEEQPTVETFLKKFHGTKWGKTFSDGRIDVWKFNNDELNPFDIWFKEKEAKCYFYFQSYKGNFEIIELSEDKLIIEIQFNEFSTNITTVTFSVDAKENIRINGTPLIEINKILTICD